MINSWCKFCSSVVTSCGCGHVADVLEIYTASIFNVNVCEVGEFLCIYRGLCFRAGGGLEHLGWWLLGNISCQLFSLHSVALESVGCTTFLIHCTSWSRWCTNPHSSKLKHAHYMHRNSPTLHALTLKLEPACTSETSSSIAHNTHNHTV